MEIALINTRNPQQKLILDKLPAIIGRDAGVEVPLQDAWVGGYQCMLDWEGDTLAVLDLGSRTGTFVNGVRIRRTRLMAGDVLTVGRTNLAVHYESVEPLAAALAASQGSTDWN